MGEAESGAHRAQEKHKRVGAGGGFMEENPGNWALKVKEIRRKGIQEKGALGSSRYTFREERAMEF